MRRAHGLGNPIQDAYLFAPRNWHDLDLADLDLGGTSAVPVNVPVVARVLAVGKHGNAYVPTARISRDQPPNCNDPGVDRQDQNRDDDFTRGRRRQGRLLKLVATYMAVASQSC